MTLQDNIHTLYIFQANPSRFVSKKPEKPEVMRTLRRACWKNLKKSLIIPQLRSLFFETRCYASWLGCVPWVLAFLGLLYLFFIGQTSTLKWSVLSCLLTLDDWVNDTLMTWRKLTKFNCSSTEDIQFSTLFDAWQQFEHFWNLAKSGNSTKLIPWPLTR